MRFDDSDITLPDNQEDFLKLLDALCKEADEALCMSKEEYETKYGGFPLSLQSSKRRNAKRGKTADSNLIVPVYDMHTFDMHWMLHYLDLFRDGISLKEYVRRARRDGSDITMKWYNIVEKYRFTEDGIRRMGRQELGYKGRQLLEQLDVYVDLYKGKLTKREQQFAGTWKPMYEWDKPIEGDTPEQLRADRKMFDKFLEQYSIINSYYPELPDIASSIYLSDVLGQNEKNFPDTDWRSLYKKFEDADIDYDTSVNELVKIGLIDKDMAADCKTYGLIQALDLLKNTPLQYHALIEENETDNPHVINPQMDAEDAGFDKIGKDYDSHNLAKLNFARAVIADHLWSDM